jgi:hypothetical protein
MGRLCFSTYVADMKECDAPESNITTIEVPLTKKYTNDHVWSFLGFLHCNVIDLSVNIVLSSSNRNRISPTGSRRGGHGCLRRVVALTGALVGKVTFLPTSEAPPFTL